jgi:hypothetical protein
MGSNGRPLSDFVDMIEINTCLEYKEVKDPETKERTTILNPIYTQVIVYNWNAEYCRYEVSSWMILIDSAGPRHDYHVTKHDNIYNLTIYRVNKNITNRPQTITLRSKMFRYTKSLAGDDPERYNQKFLAQHERLENLLLLSSANEYTVSGPQSP